jgi:hypothetical protein
MQIKLDHYPDQMNVEGKTQELTHSVHWKYWGSQSGNLYGVTIDPSCSAMEAFYPAVFLFC